MYYSVPQARFEPASPADIYDSTFHTPPPTGLSKAYTKDNDIFHKRAVREDNREKASMF